MLTMDSGIIDVVGTKVGIHQSDKNWVKQFGDGFLVMEEKGVTTIARVPTTSTMPVGQDDVMTSTADQVMMYTTSDKTTTTSAALPTCMAPEAAVKMPVATVAAPFLEIPKDEDATGATLEAVLRLQAEATSNAGTKRDGAEVQIEAEVQSEWEVQIEVEVQGGWSGDPR